MQHINRSTVSRVSALILALMLLLSCTASYAAASFTAKGAGVKYNGTFKLGATTSESDLKKAFGKSYTRMVGDPCTCCAASFLYKFKSKGIEIETRKKTEKSKEQIIGFTVTKKTVPTIAGLRVGDKTSKIQKLYGKNCMINRAKTKVVYNTGDYYLEITTKNKKITRISILWDLQEGQ